MIDTAYSLAPFPSAQTALPSPIAFKPRSAPPAVAATPVPAARVFRTSRRKTRYFLAGLVMMLALVQAATWLPIEGIELVFVRAMLLVGAGICFVVSGESTRRDVHA